MKFIFLKPWPLRALYPSHHPGEWMRLDAAWTHFKEAETEAQLGQRRCGMSPASEGRGASVSPSGLQSSLFWHWKITSGVPNTGKSGVCWRMLRTEFSWGFCELFLERSERLQPVLSHGHPRILAAAMAVQQQPGLPASCLSFLPSPEVRALP